MKNLFYLSVLVLTAGLAACASDEVNEGRNYRYAGEENCGTNVMQQVAPRPAPVMAPAPVAQGCACQPPAMDCGCPAREYTVRTPVKVVYQNTTYRTVYEPRTFQTTSFETRPYNRAEVCEGGNCGTPALVSRRPM